MPLSLRSLSVLLLAVVVLTGCRSYGEHGSQEVMYDQMQLAVDQFESDLNRARADLDLLLDAAEEEEALQAFVEAYRRALERHENHLEEHQRAIERYDGSSSHRDLRRNYGAIITEQRMVRNRYDRLHEQIQFTRLVVEEEDAPLALDRSRYALVPSFYDRTGQPDPPTMREALGG